jgi:hypothetical protein
MRLPTGDKPFHDATPNTAGSGPWSAESFYDRTVDRESRARAARFDGEERAGQPVRLLGGDPDSSPRKVDVTPNKRHGTNASAMLPGKIARLNSGNS